MGTIGAKELDKLLDGNLELEVALSELTEQYQGSRRSAYQQGHIHAILFRRERELWSDCSEWVHVEEQAIDPEVKSPIQYVVVATPAVRAVDEHRGVHLWDAYSQGGVPGEKEGGQPGLDAE